ncbi:MAG: sugar phosphate isomerase/epimerase family protein, partial [Armatimonadota bacterium]
MYLSLTTWLFEHLTVPEMVRHVLRCGYENIEVSGSRAYAEWDMTEVAGACADAGITVRSVHCAHHAVKGLEDDEGGYAAFHEEFYDRIACFEEVVVVEHIPFDPALADRTEERLLRLADKCAALGFTCSTENLRDRSEAERDVLRRVLSGPVHLTLDAKHAAAAGIDPLDYFEFADRIVNIHALDHYANAPFGDWIAVGAGDIDWRAILVR